MLLHTCPLVISVDTELAMPLCPRKQLPATGEEDFATRMQRQEHRGGGRGRASGLHAVWKRIDTKLMQPLFGGAAAERLRMGAHTHMSAAAPMSGQRVFHGPHSSSPQRRQQETIEMFGGTDSLLARAGLNDPGILTPGDPVGVGQSLAEGGGGGGDDDDDDSGPLLGPTSTGDGDRL